MQPNVQPAAPTEEPSETGRDARGRYVPGNTGHLIHGRRSVVLRLALMDERRAALAEMREAILSDLGGAATVSTLRAGLIERYLETSLMAEWLGGNLLVGGVVTAKGHARAAATLYLQVLDRLQRLASAIGLEKRPRDITDLARAFAEQDRASRQKAPQTVQNGSGSSPATADGDGHGR